ncbi:hypothetical protein [Helicobacter kayseriensis]|uniref:hypothetical protein n=1 Tax=Helicobacter kayseriensis TaxID=2905877 RepID=UPI001E2E7FEE|nr:hypothetical protein [Helicobacter kayseriensis]MCE3047232.1 hypothetical protein [Helicobacter kayseriensis]MCE3048603.1 hypothetical protein [Helicobacter kayseriensis]
MRLSFITPNKKSLISSTTASWLLCFIASTLVIIGFWTLLEIQSKSFERYSQDFEQNIKHQQNIQSTLNQELDFLNSQLEMLKNINQQNISLINATKNLFDLIPDQITINSIALTDDMLTLKGITPSKELYIFLLGTPLKAIFSESRVDFFVLPSGWYNFVSVSKIIPIKAQQ